MPNTLQSFFAAATPKASADLVAAFLRLPEDRRDWSPQSTARSAVDQVAECAILNGYTADLIQTRRWPIGDFNDMLREKAAAAATEWEALHALLETNTQRVVVALSAVPDDALDVEVAMPWGAQTLAEIIAYPYWNMTYHQGQINYIASILASPG